MEFFFEKINNIMYMSYAICAKHWTKEQTKLKVGKKTSKIMKSSRDFKRWEHTHWAVVHIWWHLKVTWNEIILIEMVLKMTFDIFRLLKWILIFRIIIYLFVNEKWSETHTHHKTHENQNHKQMKKETKKIIINALT